MAFESMDKDVAVEVDGVMVSVDKGEARAIPLGQLFLSEKNVRTVRNAESLPALAATILAQGLLYPLCVVAERAKGSKAKGETFGVVAGGRRLAALQLLVKEGKLQGDVAVSCLVFTAEHAVAVSLTENTQQEAMHPADQLVAFKALVAEGKTVGQIAAAFGVSPTTVEKRLALANLAPKFIDLYRESKIELGQLQALALTSDHAQQIAVWESLPNYQRSAYMLRKALTENEVVLSSPLARLVGLKAYRAAGGTVREDLFADSGKDSVYLQDVALLNSLATSRLETVAQSLRDAGWRWAEARFSFDASERSRFTTLYPHHDEPVGVEAEYLAELDDELRAIDQQIGALENMPDDLTDEQEEEYSQLEDHRMLVDRLRDDLLECLERWTPEQMALAGAVVSLDYDAKIKVTAGLVRAEDRKEAAAAAQAGTAGMGMTEGTGPKERAEFSVALCQNMTAHRTAAVAASLTQNPHIALAALLHTIISAAGEPWNDSPVKVRFDTHSTSVQRNAADYDASKASELLASAEQRLASLPTGAALFSKLLAMSSADLLDLLAGFVAQAYTVQSPDPVRRMPRGGFDLAQGIESALGLDMADWWYPSIEKFLGHVPKAKMIEAVTECVGAEHAQPIEKMKKADAIAAAASMLDGRRWLPSTLRPYAAPVAAMAEDVAEDDADEEAAEG